MESPVSFWELVPSNQKFIPGSNRWYLALMKFSITIPKNFLYNAHPVHQNWDLQQVCGSYTLSYHRDSHAIFLGCPVIPASTYNITSVLGSFIWKKVDHKNKFWHRTCARKPSYKIEMPALEMGCIIWHLSPQRPRGQEQLKTKQIKINPNNKHPQRWKRGRMQTPHHCRRSPSTRVLVSLEKDLASHRGEEQKHPSLTALPNGTALLSTSFNDAASINVPRIQTNQPRQRGAWNACDSCWNSCLRASRIIQRDIVIL